MRYQINICKILHLSETQFIPTLNDDYRMKKKYFWNKRNLEIIQQLYQVNFGNNIMSESEINELFTYLSQKQQNEIAGQKMKEIFTTIFKESNPSCTDSHPLKKDQFADIYRKTVRSPIIQDDLLFLFYHLDKEKKGYLSPNDVISMFDVFGKKVTLNQIQNSFKYAKVFKNKMSFEDFKQYFYNF